MNNNSILPPEYRYDSYFLTTRRNFLLHNLANLVIVPTYLACVFAGTRDLPPTISLVLRLLAFAPIIGIYITPVRLSQGIRHSELLVIVCIFIMGILGLNTRFEENIYIRNILHSISFVWLGLSLFYIGVTYWRLRLVAFLLLIISATLVALLIATYLSVFPISDWNTWFAGGGRDRWLIRLQDSTLLQYRGMQVIYLVVLIYSVYRVLQLRRREAWRMYFSPLSFCLARLFFAFLLFILAALWLLDQSLQARALISLLVMLMAAGTSQFFSRQKAYVRLLTQTIRHDWLYSFASPFINPRTIINRLLYQWLPRYLSFNNQTLFISLSLLVGGVLLPLGFNDAATDDSSNNPFTLMILGIVSSAVLIIVYYFLRLLRYRHRYVVSSFKIPDYKTAEKEQHDLKQVELQAIADLATHMLIQELQHASSLLKRRQVENVHLTGDDNNAVFITSGLEQDFVDSMHSAINVEVSGSTFDLTRLFGFALWSLASIRIGGKVQRLTNGNIQIWVELQFRNSQSAAVEVIIVHENDLPQIDERFVRPHIRELALKLLVQLGQVGHISLAWQSLDYFLRGLEASNKRNWWQAISYYQRALQHEETMRGKFGLGHYHLGAALVFQGNWQEGLEHLRIAETDGPPIPETQYMLALVLMYVYWGELDKKTNIFQEIEHRCERAIFMRRGFSEAYQLRGTVHYRRGKLFERGLTHYKAPDNALDSSQYRYHYFHAARFFWQALQRYDRQLRAMQIAANWTTVATGEEELHPFNLRVTAAHQIGDALRSLRLFMEADTFYQDVTITHPRNLRNLTDATKNYCLNENWQHAEEFQWRTVFNYPVAYWDADVCLHMGWTLAGGIFDGQTSPLKRWLDAVARRVYRQKSEDWAKTPAAQLTRAVDFIDYALLQRPRYIAYWRQTNWFRPFLNSLELLHKHFFDDDVSYIERQFQRDNDKDLLGQSAAWIALRLNRYHQNYLSIPFKDGAAKGMWKKFTDKVISRLKQYATTQQDGQRQALQTFIDISETIRLSEKADSNTITDKLVKLVELSEREGRRGGLLTIYHKTLLAHELYLIWTKAHDAYETLITTWTAKTAPTATTAPEEKLTFTARWVTDVYAELALLTCRMLASCQAYEVLLDVARKSCVHMGKWRAKWQEDYRLTPESSTQPNLFTFSPRVFRYQRASLHTWQAFALYHCEHDCLTKARQAVDLPAEPQRKTSTDYLDNMREELAQARTDLIHFPFAMYVQALWYKEQGLHEQAIEEYRQIIDIIAPYDPKRHIGVNGFEIVGPEPTNDTNRSHLYYAEKVLGRQQFSEWVNTANIHMAIADIYREMHQPNHVIGHLTEAVRWSPYQDMDIEAFLILATDLNNAERYQEAQSVVEALKVATKEFDIISLSHIRRIEIQVMEAVILTRRRHHAMAFDLARRLAHEFYLISAPEYVDLLRVRWHRDDKKPYRSVIFEPDFQAFLRLSDKILDILATDQREIPNTGLEKIPLPLNSKDALIKFPGIFTRWDPHQEKLFEQTQVWAGYLGNQAALNTLMGKITDYTHAIPTDQTERNRVSAEIFRTQQMFNRIAMGHMAWHWADQSYTALVQFANLSNALAYNRAETGLHIVHAYGDSYRALRVLTALYDSIDRSHPLRKPLSRDLARFYDTYGWIHHEGATKISDFPQLHPSPTTHTEQPGQSSTTPVNLEAEIRKKLIDAEKLLRRGLRYDPYRAIIPYHLACLQMSMMQYSLYETQNAEHLLGFQERLQNARMYLEIASSLDFNGRLNREIADLNNRLRGFEKSWQARQSRIVEQPNRGEGN